MCVRVRLMSADDTTNESVYIDSDASSEAQGVKETAKRIE